MRTRTVILDHTFIDALRDETSPPHADAQQLYRQLLGSYVAGTDRLVALSSVLATLPNEYRRHTLAPVQTLWVARQHRHSADRVAIADSRLAALTIVMMQRERIHTVATTSSAYDQLAVEVLRINSRTAPPSDPQSMAG